MAPKRESREKRNTKEDFAKQRKEQIWDSVYHARRKLKEDREKVNPQFI